MNLSYWEHQSWLSNIDYTIVGSGIVGLNAALHLKDRFPYSRILILERGMLPSGASTKNAGFACFGSLSEILDDLGSHSETEVKELVQKRVEGLELLRKNLGDKALDYHIWGGYEIFFPEDIETQSACVSRMETVNELLRPVFNEDIFSICGNKFGFKNTNEPFIFNKFEGQINTGKMMEALLQKVQKAGVKILNNVRVEEYSEKNTSVEVKTEKFQFSTNKLIIATNGFAYQLGISATKAVRGQVLVTKPIENLEIKGTFHINKGYHYFRNIDDRILIGGGRNLDFKAEETSEFGETCLIQDKLEELLKTTILPGKHFEIDRRWSGIMGMGDQKKPIVKQHSNNIYCGVRLGGMGVAIGSLTGHELAELVAE